jgi:glycosyltransferase involved in cell wall biosynthesis
MSLRIGILGTRGIPNHYGGFEQFAEHLSIGLAGKGHEVSVYNSHNHPYQAKSWNSINIVHCFDPSRRLGTFSQFIYDLNCLRDASLKHYDVILMLGYTSSSVWCRFFPGNSTVLFNMDGMEWKRKKYNRVVRRFLLYAEKLAVKCGHFFIADSPVIQEYLQQKYSISCEHIAYGATILHNENSELLAEYDIAPHNYFLIIARMEPENNIGMILDAFASSASVKKFIVIGNTDNSYGRQLVNTFRNDSRIKFIGGLYDNPQKIHSLKIFSHLYFHGHSVGGTNPSLLEAMASRALIAAHDNPFNRAVLGNNAYYFKAKEDIKNIIDSVSRGPEDEKKISENLFTVKEHYNWETITEKYDKFIRECFGKRKS